MAWIKMASEADQEGIDWINYSSLGISAVLFTYFRLLIIYIGSISNNRTLDRNMLSHLILASINLYYDTVPKGQIFNKLSNGLFKIVIGKSFMFYNVASYSANLIGYVSAFAFFQPYCLIEVPFIIIFYLR